LNRPAQTIASACIHARAPRAHGSTDQDLQLPRIESNRRIASDISGYLSPPLPSRTKKTWKKMQEKEKEGAEKPQ
jgi:hypothetical protein